MSLKHAFLPLLAAAGLLVACKSSSSQEAEMVSKNANCPISGKPVDSASYYEWEGKRIYTCCDHCIEKVAADPETAMNKAYGK